MTIKNRFLVFILHHIFKFFGIKVPTEDCYTEIIQETDSGEINFLFEMYEGFDGVYFIITIIKNGVKGTEMKLNPDPFLDTELSEEEKVFLLSTNTEFVDCTLYELQRIVQCINTHYSKGLLDDKFY